MFKNFLKDNNTIIEEIKLIIDGLGSSSSVDDIKTNNPYLGIDEYYKKYTEVL
jgi:hypothetical protein